MPGLQSLFINSSRRFCIQDFNDFSFLLGRVGRLMGLMGPVGHALAWPALQDASARFAAQHLLAPRQAVMVSVEDQYASVVGGFKAVLIRDDGPEHTSAPLAVTTASTAALELAQDLAAPHGSPDEPGSSGQEH